MGHDLSKLIQEGEGYVFWVKKGISNEDIKLTKSQRNSLRKSVLIGVQNVIFVYNKVHKVKKVEHKFMMSRAEDLNIQVFDGSGYSMWWKRIMLLLKNKKCDALATNKNHTEKQPDWDELSDKALNIIWSGLSYDHLEFVQEETSAQVALNKLDKWWSSSQQVCIRNRLAKMKLKDYEDFRVFFVELEKKINDLNNTGIQVSETEKLSYLLGTVSEIMERIADLMNALPEATQTCEFVKNKIVR